MAYKELNERNSQELLSICLLSPEWFFAAVCKDFRSRVF